MGADTILARLVGQDGARERLVGAIREGRLHHAYLLVGPQGVGKRMLARGAAQRLLCSRPEGDEACGQCRSCRQVARNAHPDLHWVEPESGAGRQATLGIDRIRRLIQEAAWRPYQGTWKVLVAAEADRLTPEAQNSLLKLLEEPPGSTVILLTTSRPDRLLPTVRSRCHAVSLRTLSDEEVRAVLEERGIRGPDRGEELALLTVAAQGSPGRALDLDPEKLAGQQAAARNWVARLLVDPGWRRLGLASELAAREDVQEVLEWAILWVRDMVLVRSGSQLPLAHAQDRRELAAAAAGHGVAELTALWQALHEARRLLSGPAQRRLVLDRLALAPMGGGDPGEG